MGQPVATLEVAFEMTTAGAVSAVKQLGSETDKAAALAIGSLQKLEQASAGAIDTAAAVAGLRQLTTATSATSAAAVREFNRIEAAGESLLRSMDRQLSTVGKTTDEIRQAKVEEAALAAERVHNTELADRLRAKEADLYAAELAAQRAVSQAARAAAEDKDRAAQQATAAAAAETVAIRNAAAAYQLFQQRAREGIAAFNNSESVISSLQREALLYGKTAEQVRAMRIEEEALAAEQANLPQQAALIRNAYQKLVAVEGEHGGKLGFNTTQMMIAEGAVHRFADSLLAGMSPMRAFMMQAGDLGNIVAMDNGGVAGGLAKVKALITPVTIGIAAATAVLAIGTAAWLSYSNAIDKFDQIATGAGRVIGVTGAQMEAMAENAAAAGNISVSSAREIETTYVQTGKIGASILTGLTAATENFAKGTDQNAKQAAQALAAAFSDPSKGADELTQKYGLLDAATLAYVHDLDDQGKKTEAQAVLLKALEAQFDGAAEHANVLARAWHFIATEAENAWSAMGKAIDKAMGGGSTIEKIADLQQEKAALIGRFGAGANTSSQDQQIAALRAQLAAQQSTQNNAQAHATAVAGLNIVDQFTGDAGKGKLQADLTAVNKLLADNGKAAGLNAAQLAAARQAQDAYTHAVETYISPAEKQNQLDAIQAQIDAARTPAQKAALTAEKAVIQQKGQVITAAQAEAEAHNKGASALATASKAGLNHADTLAREAKAMEASITGTYALADAYRASGADALIAEAAEKARSAAIKNRADVEAAVDRQVRLAIAGRVAEGERAVAGLSDQSTIQERMNKLLGINAISQDEANERIREQTALLPLLAAQQAAQQRGDQLEIAKTTRALEDLDAAQQRGRDASFQPPKLDMSTTIEGLNAYFDALGPVNTLNDALQHQANMWQIIATNAQGAAQGLADAFGHEGQAVGGIASVYAQYLATQKQIEASWDKRKTQLQAQAQLSGQTATLDRETAEHQLQTQTAQIALYGDMAEAAKGFFADGSKGYKALRTAEEVFRAVQFALSLRAMAQNAAETATSIANSAARTATHAVEAVVKAISSLPFPLNLAAGAATAAAIAALGVSIVHSFGGSSNTLPKDNKGTGTVLGDSSAQSDSIKRSIDLLGDVDTATMHYSAEMASSLKSIDSQIGSLANVIVRLGGADGINASAGVQTGFKSSLSGGAIGLALGGPIGSAINSVITKIPIVGGIVSGIEGVIKSLFGTKTSVIGSGIYGGSQSLGSVLSGGFDLQNYSDVEKKKKFFGITTGTSYSTQYGAADPAIAQQFALILKSFDDAITAAAGPLGLATDDITKRLDSFVVNIGKIDLQGLTGQQIEDKLQAVFGAAADNMAAAAIPGLEKFQKVGEGYFDTLVRVASTIEQVSSDLTLLGRSVAGLSVDAKMGLAGQFNSVSDLNTAVSTYFQDFYTDAEQAAAKTAQLSAVFTSLGVAMPGTIDSFRQLVDGQDLTTAAGQEMYATLLKLAPAFASVVTAGQSATSASAILRERQDLEKQLAELEGNTVAARQAELAALYPANRSIQQRIYDLQDEQAAVQAANAVSQERQGLMQQLWQLEGDTTALRAQQLAQLDPTNRALQEQIFALQDQQEAAQAAQQAAEQAAQAADQLRQAWSSVGDSIEQEIARIRGLGDTSGAQGYASLQAQFNAAVTAARGGDQDAAKSLPDISKSLLDAAANVATSHQELARIQAATAVSLQSVDDMISAITGASAAATAGMIGTGSASVDQQSWWATFAANARATGSTAANDELATAVEEVRDVLKQVQSDQRTIGSQLAAPLNKMATVLDRVSRDSGGTAFTVEVDGVVETKAA